eukprot:CAMPEP_0197910016 /NCGR_PEP_ID=MMETSP1439-20131203/70074_1 /TAXON_ID=66791 /ORGANISM="Gonyaulax spinifera, Strain CCMP409" /LENGTH=363 /DNA_ID=CAMNT_0043531633 /DNA_START=55 /DNA_END=1146 /DNA_ORIENTATION=+
MTRVLSALCLLALSSAEHAKVFDVDSTASDQESVQMPEPKRFMDVVRDMRDRWHAHKQAQMHNLEPWKVKAYEEKRMQHRGERQRVQRGRRESQEESQEVSADAPPAKELVVQQMAERQAVEDRKISKFGEQWTFSVQDLLEKEFLVKFRSKTHLRVLMNSITQHLELSAEEAAKVKFVFNGQELMSSDTPELVGMKDKSVIHLEGEAMEELKRQEESRAKRNRMKAHLQAKADVARNQEHLAHARKQIATERREVELRQAEATYRHFKEQNMVHLRFNDERGHEVRLGFKRDNWLSGLMSIACKRLGYTPEVTHFKVKGTNIIIKPTDSAHSLGLHDDAVITMKVNRQHGAEAPSAATAPMV